MPPEGSPWPMLIDLTDLGPNGNHRYEQDVSISQADGEVTLRERYLDETTGTVEMETAFTMTRSAASLFAARYMMWLEDNLPPEEEKPPPE